MAASKKNQKMLSPEKCVGHSIKLLGILKKFGPFQESPLWCPKLVNGLHITRPENHLAKCALQQSACKRLKLSLPVYAYISISNPKPAITSWGTNSYFHFRVPKISSGERELACGGGGCQRLLKGKLQIT